MKQLIILASWFLILNNNRERKVLPQRVDGPVLFVRHVEREQVFVAVLEMGAPNLERVKGSKVDVTPRGHVDVHLRKNVVLLTVERNPALDQVAVQQVRVDSIQLRSAVAVKVLSVVRRHEVASSKPEGRHDVIRTTRYNAQIVGQSNNHALGGYVLADD
jgi:hypothetical protein